MPTTRPDALPPSNWHLTPRAAASWYFVRYTNSNHLEHTHIHARATTRTTQRVQNKPSSSDMCEPPACADTGRLVGTGTFVLILLHMSPVVAS